MLSRIRFDPEIMAANDANKAAFLTNIFSPSPEVLLSPRERTDLYTAISSGHLIESLFETFSSDSGAAVYSSKEENLDSMVSSSKAELELIFGLDPGVDLNPTQRNRLYTAMSPRCLIQSYVETFTLESGEEYPYFRIESIQETFLLLKGKSKLIEEVANIIVHHFRGQLKDIPLWEDAGAELLPVLPILLECPAFDRPDTEWGRRIIDLMAFTMMRMKKEAEKNFVKIVSWWNKNTHLLGRVVRVFLQAFKSQSQKDSYMKLDGPYLHYLGMLGLLSEINKSFGFKLDPDQFYLGQVENAESVRNIGERLLMNHRRELLTPELRQLSLLYFPFLLDVPTKWKIISWSFRDLQWCTLQILQLAQNIEFLQIARSSEVLIIQQSVSSLRFEIDNNKDRTLESAISNMSGRTNNDLLLPLEVHFTGDRSLGVNAGGPMKEFFSRLFEELFDLEKNSIFKKLDDTPSCTTYWFNKEYKEMDKLKSIGQLLTLMFYNNVIITLPFPILFYKKLLEKSKSSFEDLRLLEPGMAEGMEKLLEMSDEELSHYQFTVDGPENEPEIELKPGGKDEVVTTANVREYLELYARHYTAASHFEVVSESFRNLLRQFNFNQLFTPQELMSLFLGGGYDWNVFEESFTYQNGYTADHEVVRMFWSVFQGDLDEAQKRDFLRFITGADHVPRGGFREIGARMWPLGTDKDCKGMPPEDMCPEVNTCHGFVVVHLPMYSKREHVRERLSMLLKMKGQGFNRITM